MDDVTLELQPQWTVIGIAGSRAAASLAGCRTAGSLFTIPLIRNDLQGHAVKLSLRPTVRSFRGNEIWMERESLLQLLEYLAGSRRRAVALRQRRVIAHIG